MKKYLIIFCFLFLACEPGFVYVFRKNAILPKQCPKLTMEWTQSESRLARMRYDKGKIIIDADKRGYTRIFSPGQTYYENFDDSDYMRLYSSSIGSVPEWSRIIIRCQSTGEILYDSGRIYEKDAFCIYDEDKGSILSTYRATYLWMYDGHAQKEAWGPCCPEGLKCPK